MKNYFGVLIGFLVLLAATWIGAMTLMKQHGWDQMEIQRIDRERNILDIDRAGYEAEIAKMDRYTPLIEQFVSSWGEHLQITDSTEEFTREIQNRLTRMTQAHFISPTSRNLDSQKNYDFMGEQRSVYVLSWTVTGPYERVMNWFGQIEKEFPLIRAEEVKIAPIESDQNSGPTGANILKMSVRLIYPNFSKELPS